MAVRLLTISMLMVFIVDVLMIMLQEFVLVLMFMLFGQMEPDCLRCHVKGTPLERIMS